ncbi:interferon-induced protein 44-like isoform X1 [Xiphophorus maculatus]|uniref:interferon-induced protein 44-like isoform X1 n=1 Tax=Xiphophorus maculatus TaxID=8083 RepID=UPI000C6CEEDA|nr:interferon-induced protein 44-like isoform X1 [Xiphophorus maculatus]
MEVVSWIPWSNSEVQTFLCLVGQERIHRDLDGATRNEKTFREISQLLAAHGYQRTSRQCRDKLKKMKSDYRTIKENRKRSGPNSLKHWKWFEQMDAIYGKRPVSIKMESGLDSTTAVLDPMMDNKCFPSCDGFSTTSHKMADSGAAGCGVLVNGSDSKPAAAAMHANDLNLTQCEVYQVVVTPKETTKIENPWRTLTWNPEKRTELMDTIKAYKPTVSSVPQTRVLLIGPVGAGKSSFFNSINSVFRGHVTSQAIAGSSSTSLTTQFRTYSVKAGREGKPLPIILCDTMGLEESKGAGLDVDDISSILEGHMPNRYQALSFQFNPSEPLHPDTSGYRKSPDLKEKIHCLSYILDATKVFVMPEKLAEKLKAIRQKANLLGVPQLVVLTKVDDSCPLVKENLTNIYRSVYIKEIMQEASTKLGMPLSCIVPVRNYVEELDLDLNSDVLLLSAVIQMLRFADNYFDEISDQLGNLQNKE